MIPNNNQELEYKTKIYILANKINVILKYISKPPSWYMYDNILYKIEEDKYEFKIKNGNDIIDFNNKKIILGCMYENTLYKLEIKNLKIVDGANRFINSSLRLIYDQKNDTFIKNNSSHYDCDIIKLDKITIDIPYWINYQNNEKRIERLATKERIENFGKQDDKQKRSAKFKSKEEFLEWYKEQQKICCYCGIKEKDLELYFNENNPQYYIDENNKARQRGRYLEVERIVTLKPKNAYSKENCALACYICNNAKSDFLSPKSFKPIAKGINEFWNQILKKNISHKYKKVIFPEKSKIWDKK